MSNTRYINYDLNTIGNIYLTGSLDATSGSLTGSLLGTSSYSLTSSFIRPRIKYEQFNVSSSITMSLNFDPNFYSHHVNIISDVGVSPYTASFILPLSNSTSGSKTSIKLQIISSSNPNIIFYSDIVSPTYLLSVAGISGSSSVVVSEFIFNGSSWELFYAGYDN